MRIKKILSASANVKSNLVMFPDAGHAAFMFAKEKELASSG